MLHFQRKKVDELVGFDNISKAKEEDAVLDGVVLNVVKGGILVSVDGVRVFRSCVPNRFGQR